MIVYWHVRQTRHRRHHAKEPLAEPQLLLLLFTRYDVIFFIIVISAAIFTVVFSIVLSASSHSFNSIGCSKELLVMRALTVQLTALSRLHLLLVVLVRQHSLGRLLCT